MGKIMDRAGSLRVWLKSRKWRFPYRCSTSQNLTVAAGRCAYRNWSPCRLAHSAGRVPVMLLFSSHLHTQYNLLSINSTVEFTRPLTINLSHHRPHWQHGLECHMSHTHTLLKAELDMHMDSGIPLYTAHSQLDGQCSVTDHPQT
jgi:hypothetical protein